jgi:hypothetical protein
LYEHISKTFITNALRNGATFSTSVKKVGSCSLDLIKVDSFMLGSTIDFTNTTNPFTACVWFKPNPDVSVYDGDDAGRFVIVSTQSDNLNVFVDSNPNPNVFTYILQVQIEFPIL